MDFNTMFEDHNDADYRVFDNYTQVSQLASDNFANSTGSFLNVDPSIRQLPAGNSIGYTVRVPPHFLNTNTNYVRDIGVPQYHPDLRVPPHLYSNESLITNPTGTGAVCGGDRYNYDFRFPESNMTHPFHLNGGNDDYLASLRVGHSDLNVTFPSPQLGSNEIDNRHRHFASLVVPPHFHAHDHEASSTGLSTHHPTNVVHEELSMQPLTGGARMNVITHDHSCILGHAARWNLAYREVSNIAVENLPLRNFWSSKASIAPVVRLDLRNLSGQVIDGLEEQVEIGNIVYTLGTARNPSSTIIDILSAKVHHDLSLERAKLRRHLVDKFAPRIKNGEFGDFGNLWARIEGGISNIKQLVDDVTNNVSCPWGSKLLTAIFRDIVEYYGLKDALDRIGGCITLPLLQLAVSCAYFLLCYVNHQIKRQGIMPQIHSSTYLITDSIQFSMKLLGPFYANIRPLIRANYIAEENEAALLADL